MSEFFAFIDESGNEGIDLGKPNVTRTYVVISLVMTAEQKEAAQTHFSAVKGKYFRNCEMKSATIGGNDRLRTHVLADLLAGDFLIFALVVDKAELLNLQSKGFQYPKSFIKNIQQRLYSRVLSGQQLIHVTADQIKTPSFTTEFRNYIEAHNESGLFKQWSYELVNSEKSVFIQAADVIAGTIRMFMELNPATDCSQVWRQQLSPRFADFRVSLWHGAGYYN